MEFKTINKEKYMENTLAKCLTAINCLKLNTILSFGKTYKSIDDGINSIQEEEKWKSIYRRACLFIVMLVVSTIFQFLQLFCFALLINSGWATENFKPIVFVLMQKGYSFIYSTPLLILNDQFSSS